MIKKALKQPCSKTTLISVLVTAISATLLCTCMAFAACQVSLQWDAGADSAIAGYRLFSRTAVESFDYGKPLWEGNGNQYTVTNLLENTQYHFVLRAFNAQGAESPDSNEVVFIYDPNPPAMPVPQGPADNASDVSIIPGATPNLVAGAYSDVDSGQYHSMTHWQIFRQDDSSPEDPCVFDLYSNFYLTQLYVPPSILENSATYYWTVSYSNQIGSTSAPAPFSYFTTETAKEDQNLDGIPDTQEIDCGASANLSANARQSGAKCINTEFNDIQASLSCNDDAAASIVIAQAVDPVKVTPAPAELSAEELPAGLINFKIKLAQAGAEAGVTISYSEEIPENDAWLMFTPAEGYREYPGDSELSADRRSITCRLKDGGTGDMDGIANGYIAAMGGYGRATGGVPAAVADSSPPASSGGGGSCFISTLH